MKTCQFCHEDIHDEEVECPFCDKSLNKPNQKDIALQFKTIVVITALITAGPLALPLVWFHPTYKITTKIIFTVVTTIVTILCILAVKVMFQYMMEQIRMLQLHY